MRRFVSRLFIVAGIATASLGFEHLAAAWWFQQHVTVASFAPPSPFFPPGFAGELRIPRLDTSLGLVNQHTDSHFRRGPGFISGSDRPGGLNCIIAGHRDLHFRILRNVRIGDRIEIDSPEGKFIYRVASCSIVSPTNVDSLRRIYPRQLTLVTCYPFYYVGPAPKRFVVRAELQ